MIYENVGEYSGVTDRCYNGGTIVNYKVPETKDSTPIAFYQVLMGASILILCFLKICFVKYGKARRT